MGERFLPMAGCPVRVTFLDEPPGPAGQPVTATGLLDPASHDGLAIRLINPVTLVTGEEVLVEIQHPGGLLRHTGRLDSRQASPGMLRVLIPPGQRGEQIQRRRHSRVATNLPAWVEAGGTQFQARVTNLSVGGAAVLTTAPCAAGMRVEMGFGVGHGLPLGPLRSRVVRVLSLNSLNSVERDAAIMFLELSEAEERQIQQYVDRHLPQSLLRL